MRAPEREAMRKPVVGISGGFTLVELLVVITIIGILMAILLPAVQAAREAARRAQCANNLKQLSLACLDHEQSNGFLPSAGQGWCMAGEPTRGFGSKQPGGWLYSVLPFVELAELHDLGVDGNRAVMTQRASTPVGTFICPSRRRVLAYPFLGGGHPGYANIATPGTLGRSDYAGCGGSSNRLLAGICVPISYGDAQSPDWWSNQNGGARQCTGVFFLHSQTRMTDITDGASNTYLAGEKYGCPDWYETGEDPTDDQGWDSGWDGDTVRWTNHDGTSVPSQDRPGCNLGTSFGSAHPGSFNMALCDGSVRTIDYSIDTETHYRLGSCADGLLVEEKKL
jgi:prepilin-type N-terminal cleavage/methylation domain-containing protein/prepilin-type processing-associated H-X9-DG protein